MAQKQKSPGSVQLDTITWLPKLSQASIKVKECLCEGVAWKATHIELKLMIET